MKCKKLDSGDGDSFRIKNALAALMFARGAPIIYYGTEQGLDGHQANVLEQLGRKHSSTTLVTLDDCEILKAVSRRFSKESSFTKRGHTGQRWESSFAIRKVDRLMLDVCAAPHWDRSSLCPRIPVAVKADVDRYICYGVSLASLALLKNDTDD